MAIYQRGDNWYIDFWFKGQRIGESIEPSQKDAEQVINKKENRDQRKQIILTSGRNPSQSSFMSLPRNICNGPR